MKKRFRECQVVFATRIHPGLWGQLDKSMSPRVGDFAQKSYPQPNYPGGGTLRATLDRPIKKKH